MLAILHDQRGFNLFDSINLIDFLKNLSKQPADMQKKWTAFEDYLLKDRATRKYANLVAKGMYIPDFFADEFVKGTNAITALLIPENRIAQSSNEIYGTEE